MFGLWKEVAGQTAAQRAIDNCQMAENVTLCHRQNVTDNRIPWKLHVVEHRAVLWMRIRIQEKEIKRILRRKGAVNAKVM